MRKYLNPNADGSSGPQLYRVVTDGVAEDITMEELIRRAQKGKAADQRLQEAASRAAALDAREAKLGDFEQEKKDWEAVRSTGDVEAFRRLAAKNTTSTPEEIDAFIESLQTAKSQNDFGARPAPRGSNMTQNDDSHALNPRAAKNLARIEKLFQDADAAGIDVLSALQTGAAAADHLGKQNWKKTVTDALANHAGLRTIMREGSPIDRDKLSDLVWRRVEKMVAAGQKPTSAMVNDLIGDTVDIMDLTARGVQTHNKNTHTSVPGIGSVPSDVNGLAGIAPTEPPTLDPNDLAGSINRMQAYARSQGGNDLSEYTVREDYEPGKLPSGVIRSKQ